MLHSARVRRNVEQWVAGKSPHMLKVEIWPTARCNLGCRICGSWRRDREQDLREEMTDDQLRSIIGECLEMGAEEFLFSGGGEPWLRGKLLLELMGDIKAAGRIGHVTTNGTLFSRDDAKEMTRVGWNSVILSVDGPSAGVHDFLRGKDDVFERVQGALRSFRREKQRSGTEIPSLVLNCVITNRNAHLVHEMLHFAAKEGCDKILFEALMPLTENFADLALSPEEQRSFMDFVDGGVQLARELGIRTNLGHFSSEIIFIESDETHKILGEQTVGMHNRIAAIPCYEPWRGLWITPDGRISLCPRLAQHSPPSESCAPCHDAWLGDDSERIRRMMVAGDIAGICTGCCSNRLFENRQIRESVNKE